MEPVNSKTSQKKRPDVTLAKPDATWSARIGVASFNKDGLKPVELGKLPKTADVRAVLDLAGKDQNDRASPLNDRPPLEVSAFRDEKSKQFSLLVWQPADFMGTLHVFDNAGSQLGKLDILD